MAGESFAAVYSSPLQRAVRTGELAGFADPVLDPSLVEWDYGEYDGITTGQIQQMRPGWDLWRDGCPGGEDIGQVRARARTFLTRLAEVEEGPVIAFSHGHFLRVLTLVFLGLPDSAGARINLDTAAVSVLRRGEHGNLLQLWNDTGHLPGSPS